MGAQTYAIELFGVIQGVGFRPFVYRLAHKMGLKGYVQNQYDKLFILLQVSKKEQLEAFVEQILTSAPPHAQILRHTIIPISTPCDLSQSFEIKASSADRAALPILLPLDIKICESCLKDMRTEGRFYQYAFSTCTDCGARYSMLKALPYDRIHTAMSDFPLCEFCQSDYHNPLNRRFHAQPISCTACAVRLRLIDERGEQVCTDAKEDIELIYKTAEAIQAGKIVAIKGIGGFNLIVDASNKEAIATLRKRKNRPYKPFALMFKDIRDIESLSDISPLEREALLSPQAPIVLLERHYQVGGILDEETLELIAPQVRTLGAILPYNGIMHLLFDRLKNPIVFTSANLSSEPIIAQTDELLEKLCKHNTIADVILTYNRHIYNPLDDSIVRLMAGDMRILRLGRGYAPLVLDDVLPLKESADNESSKQQSLMQEALGNEDLESTKANTPLILGVGAQQKSTLCMLYGKQANISPYIGDLQSVDSIARYESVGAFLCGLYSQKPHIVVSDLHPQYISTQKAQSYEATQYALAHHKAHFYAILAEAQALDEIGLGIIWDGTGLGEDRHIWGGECFLYEPDSRTMRRLWHFDEFVFLGGEGAIKDIGKLALSLLLHYELLEMPEAKNCLTKHFSPKDLSILQGAYASGIYPLTSSVGRLFDAVAFLLGLLEKQSYEGQSGALIESCALRDVLHHSNEAMTPNTKRQKSIKISSAATEPYEFSLENGHIYLKGVIEGILNDKVKYGAPRAAHRFLETLSFIALTLAKEGKKKYKDFKVYFSGGVFQNKFLCDRIHALFTEHRIPFYMHRLLPCNDSNISFGQAVFGALQAKKDTKGSKNARAT
ncbi:MAG: carbamoyltransferase HypF [Helicobacter sp.]|uniref:carbamoyltransferase HypF n=1 Tax=Helicobacter sp. TaxID=218 RepID=UPI0025C6368C|nr:carbamoyltransferase HypF [Helicobacter sp.]MCH5313417.1 carbamoyltransferase HypF [Helicobacter sp.]